MQIINNLEVVNFRNFNKAKLNFNKSVNLIIGQNGFGKTSLLEAISLLISGNSFRPGKYENYIKFENDFSKIKIELENSYSSHQIEYKFLKNKKELLFDNKKISSSKLFQRLNYVLFSPESLSVIKNGPDERRNLIDSILSSFSSTNYKKISDFKKCLKSRNKILKDHKKEKISSSQALQVLNSLDEIYLLKSAEISFERIKVLNELKPYIKNAYNFILGDKNVDIAVDYIISSQTANKLNEKSIIELLQKRRTELINAELAMGVSLIGPHKHDIKFLHNEKDSRYFCSQGQQRAYVLAIKMAQIVYYYALFNKYPLLLLDDVMSELDETKRQNLLNFLRGIKAQIFITTTDFNLQKRIDHSNLSVYEIKSGNNSGLIQPNL